MLITAQLVISITPAMNDTAHPLKTSTENDLKVDNLTTAIKNPINKQDNNEIKMSIMRDPEL